MDVNNVLLIRVSSTVDKEVDHPQFFDPSYPLKYLQAGLHKYREVSVHLLDCWVHPMDVTQLLDYTARINPQLVVLSASSFDVQVANQFVTTLKKQKNAPLVVGIGQGHYLNHHTRENYEAGYDAILLGEPEQEFFTLFDQIGSDNLKDSTWRSHYRMCYDEGKRFIVENPDSLPFPSYTPEELESYKSIYPVQLNKRAVWGFLIATRGCPGNCTFCSEVMRVSIGKRLRSRSADNVADEMEHLAGQGVNICSFQDDSFSANRRFVHAFCKELISRSSSMAWMARVRVDELDYETLALMKEAGCIMLGIGVESGSERIIEEMCKQGRPRPWLEQCRQVFRWTRQLRIGTNAYYIIGNPTETREEIEQTIRFALELNSDSIQVHYYTPYPGSAAWEKYKDQFAGIDSTRMFHYATPLFPLAEVSVADLVDLRSKFYRRYLFRPKFAFDHLLKHARFYWHNMDVFWNLLGIRKVLM
jgi:radical SAM superfamily enzyme YgiQ (UPF0313 family)